MRISDWSSDVCSSDLQTARALLIPAAAVQTDQARKIVYVVGRDGTVAAKPVEIGPEVDGLRVIRAGLAAADRVVITGYQFARPGEKAFTKAGRIAAEPEKATASASEPLSAQATFAK